MLIVLRLTWPVVISMLNMKKEDSNRTIALGLLGEFSHHACFDNAAAGQMLKEYWNDENNRNEMVFGSFSESGSRSPEASKRLKTKPFLD